MDDFQRREKLMLEILEKSEEKEHFHQDIELLYVLKGNLELNLEGQKIVLREEDVLIINANKKHYLRSYGEILYVKLTILYELLSDILDNLDLTFVCDSSRNTDSAYDGLRKLMQQLLGHYLSTKGNTADFAYISLCYKIMDYICSYFLICSTSGTGDAESEKYQQRIRQIDNYIRANYRSAISLKDLSEKLYLSNGYLSRFFKKNYGMSFADYLTNVRLHHAVDQLLYTDMPITRIVFDNGFSSVAIFNKAFKSEYGETPSEVRKRAAKKKKLEEEPVLSEELEKRLENVLWKEGGNTRNEEADTIRDEISVNQGKKLDRIWNSIINIGYAEDLLRSEVQEHVVILKNLLKFKYVRFWNPFSKELLIDINNPEHKYNFSRLDSVLDFLVSHDICPFIELENKPKRIDRTTRTSEIFELFETMKSMEGWRALMESFIKHVVSRYGGEEVKKWKFELWLDTDRLKDDLHLLTYFEKLKAAQRIIHQYSEAQIGGCGLHGYVNGTEKKSSYIRDFYRKIREAEALPDFITLYIYAYDSREENGEILPEQSRDNEYMKHAADILKRDIGSDLGDKKVCITEWNLTISDRNLINDTCFKGAYVLKNNIDLIGHVDAMAYFRGTDRVSESYDTDEFLFGGNGLLTRDGIQKPMFFAFHFLNRLYSLYVGKGTNYLITKDGHGNYSMACHNCKKLNYNYYYVEEDSLDREHMSKYFEDMDDLELHLVLKDISDGLYRMKIYRINEENGSVQRIWREMEFETDLSRDDIRYIQKASEPKLSIQKILAENGQAEIHIKMMANEIAYISLNYIG